MTEERKVAYVDLPHIGGYQKMVLDLQSGKRTPQNEEEKKILAEIKDIEAKGGMVDFELD